MYVLFFFFNKDHSFSRVSYIQIIKLMFYMIFIKYYNCILSYTYYTTLNKPSIPTTMSMMTQNPDNTIKLICNLEKNMIYKIWRSDDLDLILGPSFCGIGSIFNKYMLYPYLLYIIFVVFHQINPRSFS